MANYSQYMAAPAQVQGGPGVRVKPPQPGVNPAMVAYLSSGSPQRQLFSQMLSTRPPTRGGPTGVYETPAPYTGPVGGTPGGTPFDNPYTGPVGGTPGGTPWDPGGKFWEDPAKPQPKPTPTQASPPAAQNREMEEGDYLSDSFLQRLFGQRDADLKMKRGGAFSSYQNALLGFGSQEMVRETLGRLLSHPEYRDASGVENPDEFIEQFASGVSAEPDTSFSTLAQLRRALREDTRASDDETAKRRNLGFSGTRARALRDLDYGFQGQVNSETQALLNALNAITGNVTGAESDWMERIRGGEEAAYSRALMRALARALRTSGGGGGGGGGPSGPTGPTEPTPTGTPDWLFNQGGPGPAYIDDLQRAMDAMRTRRTVAY